jgi:hypothetical protein
MQDLKNLNYLLPKTQDVLKHIIQNEYLSNFVLVGGSALALHIKHRKSEDLDFFTYYRNKFDINKIETLLKDFREFQIVNISDEQVDCIIDGVKVTFFDAKWGFLKPKSVKRFNLANLEQLAIMKTNVLFLRAKYRDYYDMYFLAKNFGIKKIYELAKDTLEGINFKLFAAALVYVDDIEDENIDYLEPECKISLKEIKEYFEDELKKL